MDESRRLCRRDWLLLLVLLLIAFALRVWQVRTSEVAARDSIGYIHIAWQLEHDDWRTVIPATPHHPGYPIAVLASSALVRRFHPGPLPDMMELSAQLANSFASILLVVPMYCLGRALFDRRVGFWAALLFQCLPASGRILADGLSEGLFLLCAMTALWLAAIAFARRSPWCFAGVGFCGALAYLTRPEGGLLVAATGIVLAALQLQRTTRRPWGNFAASAAGLCLAALLLAGPFMLLIHGLTTSNTGKSVTRLEEPTAAVHQPVETVAQHSAVLATWWQGRPGEYGHADQRRLWALTTLLDVLCKLFFYALWLPLLLGLWVRRDCFRQFAGSWVLILVSLALLPFLYLVALKMGYLSDRHAVLILCCGSYWMVAGLLWMGARASTFFRERTWSQSSLWSGALVALTCGAGLVRTLEPMHGDRAGFREAGYWLAENARASDGIDDPYTWASYYAGRSFMEPSPPTGPGLPHTVYVVAELSDNKHPELPNRSNMDYVLAHGDLIKSWPVRRRKELAEIRLYRVSW